MASAGVEPALAWGVGALAAGAAPAVAEGEVIVRVPVGAGGLYAGQFDGAAAEHLRLLNLHHVHRGLLIIFLVHCDNVFGVAALKIIKKSVSKL